MNLKGRIASIPIITGCPSMGWQFHRIIRSDGHAAKHGRYKSPGIDRKIPIRAYAKLPYAPTGLRQPVRIGMHGAEIQTGHRNHCADEKTGSIASYFWHRTSSEPAGFLLNKGPFSQHQQAKHYAVAAQVSDKAFSHKIILQMGRMMNPRGPGKYSEDKYTIDALRRR
jgi:hypothetical protein